MGWPSKSMLFRVEPFRIFFPLGYLMAVLGLGIWVLDLLDVGFPYPGKGHPVLMMQGFAFAFSLGVILTELAKSLGDIAPVPLAHIILFPGLLFAMGASALVHATTLSQVFYFLTVLGVLIYLALSLILKRGRAHPDVVFLALALISALGGAALWIEAEAFSLPPALTRWAQLAVFQAYFLLFAFTTFHWDSPRAEGREPRAARALANLLVGAGLLAMITVEAFAPAWFPDHETLALRLAHAGKAGLVLWFIVFRVPRQGSAYQGSARWALYSILVGQLLTVWHPAQDVALAHIVYVAGFCWLVLARGAGLISLRHSLVPSTNGRGTLAFYGGMLTLGGVMRALADFFPGSRSLLLFLAVAFVLVPLVLWSTRFLPLAADGGRDS